METSAAIDQLDPPRNGSGSPADGLSRRNGPNASADGARLKVLVVDDHEIVHWGFRVILDTRPWVERALGARSYEQALELTAEHQPGVAIVDILVGGVPGVEICMALSEAAPKTRVLLLDRGQLPKATARRAGAWGCISKDSSAADLVRAVHTVAKGRMVFPRNTNGHSQLSGRELEVLQMIASGSTNCEIADALTLSPHTVKQHTRGIYRKLGARNRAEAVQLSLHLGLLVGGVH